MDQIRDIPSDDEWGYENESGRYEPDEIEILEELYAQERAANDYLIEKLKALSVLSAEDALAGIRDLLEHGYAYFDEQKPWDRPSLNTLLNESKQLDLF